MSERWKGRQHDQSIGDRVFRTIQFWKRPVSGGRLANAVNRDVAVTGDVAFRLTGFGWDPRADNRTLTRCG
ncbi:hypothetical protein RBWH47_00127 [Rhodopirellula baltica WH47]|uniref:Uncharacterized protein n=1 Tax=Rhodopirellula baltica WH47 TaxID=991778 RepID=F2B1W4_RHOBT|nr:hypothetical protein RBWH47_00127 [Rhodopirellula baltica WH47]